MHVAHPGVTQSGEYGLGNQMFQIASTIGIARTNGGLPIFLHDWNNNKYFKNKLNKLLTEPKEPFHVTEASFDYTPIVLPKDKAVVYLSGYLQSDKYFAGSEQEVRDTFEFKESNLKEVTDIKNSLNLGVTCSISVRRGDYVHLQHIHPLQPDRYWLDAQNTIESKTKIDTYIVFSDDINWCRTNQHLFKRTGKKVFFMEGRTQIDDFMMITLCDHNIITNSTFAWWGAYLNKNLNKIVVMPSLWFGPQGPWSGPSDANDLYVKGWYRV